MMLLAVPHKTGDQIEAGGKERKLAQGYQHNRKGNQHRKEREGNQRKKAIRKNIIRHRLGYDQEAAVPVRSSAGSR